MMVIAGDCLDATGVPGLETALDYVGVAFHGMAVSHLDALCHVFHDGQMYNGFPATDVKSIGAMRNSVMTQRRRGGRRAACCSTSRGCAACAGSSRATRSARRARRRVRATPGSTVEPGDIVLVSTGRDARSVPSSGRGIRSRSAWPGSARSARLDPRARRRGDRLRRRLRPAAEHPARRPGNTMADAAAAMTSTSVTRQVVGSAWPAHLNKVIAETQQKNIEAVGMLSGARPTRRWRAPSRRRSARRSRACGPRLEQARAPGELLGRVRTTSGTSRGTYPRATSSIPPTSRTCPAIAGRARWPCHALSPTRLDGRGQGPGHDGLDSRSPGAREPRRGPTSTMSRPKTMKYAPLIGPGLISRRWRSTGRRWSGSCPELRSTTTTPRSIRDIPRAARVRYPTVRD